MVSIVQYLDVPNNISSLLTIKARSNCFETFLGWLTLHYNITGASPRTSFRSLKIPNNIWQKYCQYLTILDNSDQLISDQTVLKVFWVHLLTDLQERVLERAFAR